MQAKPKTQAWTTTLLDDCLNMVQSYIRPFLQKMYENSNLAFLEFAEKAQSPASQIQFMEGLSAIQKNRSQMEDVFYRELVGSFAHFGKTSPQQATVTGEEESPLSLLSKEETDIQVAIQNMTSSATMGSAQELGALRQRLAVLNNGTKIEDKDIPASPSCLANAFHEAANVLVLEHETKLIIYMLFDKFVLSKLHPLYQEYNERLLKAGLLPNLKYTVRKNPNTGKTEPVSEEAPAAGQRTQNRHGATATGQTTGNAQSLGDEVFGNIMTLLSRRSGTAGSGGAGAVSNPLPQTEIVTAIDRVQHTPPVEGIMAEQVVVIQPGSEEHKDIVDTMSRRLTAEREQLFTGIDRRRMPAADTQVIDLIGMMFEYLLNDEDVPNVAKAELCRLHTPYLKIAIIDKTIFSDNAHPAHELLNTLTNAAGRWVFEDDLERGIFPSIRYVVQRVIDEFVDNIEIFSELLGIFNRSLNELVIKAAAIEERTRQAAAGKEKLGLSRNHAASMIEDRVTGRNVPSSIRKLLGDVWLDKLMFIYLRETDAENSPSWRLAIRTVEDIIWSVEPRFTEETQTQLRMKLPALRSRIERAFTDLEAYGTSDNNAHLKLIYMLQEEALRQPVDEQIAQIEAVAEEPQETENSVADDNAVVPDPEPEEEVLPPEIQAAVDQLKEVAFGTWFYIQESKNEHPVRVKLSWYSKMSGNYMFVDSMGVKSTVWKQNELAALLADGKARIIGEKKAPFVKRALQAIVRILSSD